MKKLFFLLCSLINLTSNSFNIKPAYFFLKNSAIHLNSDINIPYIEAKGYYIKNTVKENQRINPIIKSEKTFSELFGYATVMGNNGKPTVINFKKQYVIAIVGNTTNKTCIINPISLVKNNNTISLNYQITEKEETLSYHSRPLLLLIIDNNYQGKVKLIKH